MRAALTARELAALKLPDLPSTESAMIRRAKAEQWSGHKRAGRGGGVEYDAAMLLKKLPEPASNALLARLSAELPALPAANDPAADAAPDASTLAQWQRDCADARAALLAKLDTLIPVLGIERAIKSMVSQAERGELAPELLTMIPVANARAGANGSRRLSRPTLYRWHADRKRDGWHGLVPQDARRAEVMPAWGMALLKLYRVPTKRALTAVLEDLPAHLPAGVDAPSYDQALRLLRRMAPVERERGRLGPNALLQLKSFKRRSTEGLLPLDVVTADGTSFKGDVAHPLHGQRFRPEVVAILDTATRYCFGHSAGLAESAHLVMDAIRHGVSRLGYFNIFYSDNGAGFTADALTHEVYGLFGRLGSVNKTSTPGRAQARGKIERPQSSLMKRMARKMVTYTGRDMDGEAKRKIDKLIEADFRNTGGSRHLMSWTDFLAFLAAEIDAYNNRPHRSLPKIRDDVTGKLRHMSPAECLQDFRDKGWEPRPVPEEIMRDLFRPHVERTVSRGEVRLPWGIYFHQRLVQFHGDKVMVAYEHGDPSKVWCRTLPDQRLICIAEKNANVVPEQPASAIEYARQKSAAARLKNIERKVELINAELGGGVIEHVPAPMSPEEEAKQAELVADFEAHGTIMIAAPANVNIGDDEPEDRKLFRRGLAIHRQLEAGERPSPEDVAWFKIYSAGSEWRALFAMYQDFGEDMLIA